MGLKLQPLKRKIRYENQTDVVEVQGDLSVTGTIANGSVSLTEPFTFVDTLTAEAAVTLESTLNVQGAADFDDDVNIDGALVLDGAAGVGGALTVTGNLLKAGANGSSYNVKTATGSKTCNSGTGTETVVGAIPAGVDLLGYGFRVTTILAGAGLTTWTAGDDNDPDLFGTGLAVAATTTVDRADATASILGSWSAAARDLVFTADAGQFDSGVIEYVIFYADSTAPTS